MSIIYAITTDFEVLSPSFEGTVVIDIEEQMLRNAIFLLELADRYAVKLSFFLELIEYRRFQETPDFQPCIEKLNRLMEMIVESGHDIQVHGHSEWVTAKYENGAWFRAWRGEDRPHDVIDAFFAIFDEALRDLRRLLGHSWSPLVYRGGGYRIDPTEVLFPQLAKRGIIADSSRHSLQFGSSWIEDSLLEIPIFGEFPTDENRWDLNLGGKSHLKCFEAIPQRATLEQLPLVMMGHTKMKHDFNAIEGVFRELQAHPLFESATISNIALSLRQAAMK